MNDIEVTKTFGVYAIESRIDSKVYVGSTTKSFSIRWKQWRSNLCRNKANKHLQGAWNKYGEDNFVFFVLEVVEDKDLVLEREQHWIDGLDVCNPEKGYNFCKDAKASRDGKRSEKQSATQRGKAPWNKGMRGEYKLDLSPEQRAERGVRQAGANNPNFGRDFSPEHRQKISERQRKFTPEIEKQIYQEYIAGNSTRTLSRKYGTCTDVIVRAVLCMLKEHGHSYSSLDDAVEAGALPKRHIKFQEPEERKAKIKAAGRWNPKYPVHVREQIFEKFVAGISVTKLAAHYGGHPDTIRASIKRSIISQNLNVNGRDLRIVRRELKSYST